MSIGGSERHTFIIAAEFQINDAASKALRAGQDIRKAALQGLGPPIDYEQLLGRRTGTSDPRRRAQDPASGQFVTKPLSPQAVLALEKSMAGATSSTQTYAEQLNHAAAQARKRALIEDDELAKVSLSIAKELDAEARVERSARSLIASREKVDAALAAEATKIREAAAARATINATQLPYPSANVTTRTGQLQETANQALLRQIAAIEHFTKVETSGAYTTEQLIHEVIRRRQAEAAYTQAIEQARVATAGQGGPGAQFAHGFRGASDRPYAEQLGQAFKFSIFYGTAYRLLTALTQTFQATLQEGILFQNQVTELQLATGRTKESAQALANEVGKEAAQYGFSPAQGAAIAARSQGYYGVTDAPEATQDAVARVSARVVNQLAFASGKQPDDIQANLAAITQAYGLGAQSQQYIGDLDAYFARKFGITAGSTIGAVSQSGTVGRAAGFSPAEVSAIAADIMARTGASESAAGGYLAQIFSRAGEGQLSALATKFNIDPNANLATQFNALAKVYQQRPEERDDISAAFGRGKVQNAVIALLQDYPTVRKEAAKATDEAGGELDRATALRLGNIGGQIQATVGSLKTFANELGQSGFLDVIGAGVVVLRELVDAGSNLLEVWNELPHAIRDVIIGFGLLYASARVTAATQGISGGVGGLTTIGRVALAERGAGGLLRAGVNGAGGFGVAAAVLGDVVLWSKFRQAGENFAASSQGWSDFLSSHEEDLSTPEGLSARASSARQAQDAAQKAAGGFFANVRNSAFGLGESDSDKADKIAAAAETEAERLTRGAKYLQSAQDNMDSRTAQILGFDSESLKTSLDQIATAGGTAAEQLDALTASLHEGGEAAKRAAANFDPKAVAISGAQGVYEALLSNPGFQVKTKLNTAGKLLGVLNPEAAQHVGAGTDLTEDILTKSVDQTAIEARLQSALAQINSLGDIDPAMLKRIATEVVGSTPQDVIDNSDGKLQQSDLADIREGMVDSVSEQLLKMKDAAVFVAKQATLTTSELTALADSILATTQAAIDQLPENDFAGRTAQAQKGLADIRAAIAKTEGGAGNASPQVLYDEQQAMNTVAQNRFARLDGLQKAAQAGVTSDAQLKAIAAPFTAKKIAVAVKYNDADLLAQIISESGESAIGLARAAIRKAEQADKAAHRVARRQARVAKNAQDAIAAFTSTISTTLKNFFDYDSFYDGMLEGLDKIQRTVDDAKPGKPKKSPDRGASKDVLDTTPYDPTANGETQETAAQRAAARAEAFAIKSQSDIASARAGILSAQVAMHDADKGTVAYYQALGQYFQARQALSDAIIAYQQNLYLLGHDITDPLDQARAATRAAAASLRADRNSGAGKDALAADRVALQQAQAQQEATAFQQRLEAVQTAEQLGRTSHAAYIRYLENESARLNRIKHRTYQQQQELNQIDGLLQSAAKEMQGQWNFGDIKLPTPYQMRRIIAERSDQLVSNARSMGTASNAAGQVVNISIDGADTAKVEKIVRDVVGGHNTLNVRTHTARRGR